MYYFTSDAHIGHRNILSLCHRPFETILEHDQEIIKRHNSLVSDADTIYDLGDVESQTLEELQKRALYLVYKKTKKVEYEVMKLMDNKGAGYNG